VRGFPRVWRIIDAPIMTGRRGKRRSPGRFGNRLYRLIPVTITWRLLRARGAGLSVAETEDSALLGPRQGQVDSLQADGCQFDRVLAVENRLDDVGREKGQR